MIIGSKRFLRGFRARLILDKRSGGRTRLLLVQDTLPAVPIQAAQKSDTAEPESQRENEKAFPCGGKADEGNEYECDTDSKNGFYVRTHVAIIQHGER